MWTRCLLRESSREHKERPEHKTRRTLAESGHIQRAGGSTDNPMGDVRHTGSIVFGGEQIVALPPCVFPRTIGPSCSYRVSAPESADASVGLENWR